MSTLKKVIKNLALAFAIFLVVNILSLIMHCVTLVGTFFFGDKELLVTPHIVELKEVSNLNIEVLTTNLIIKEGENFKIETNSEYITVKSKGNLTIITEEPIGIFNTREVADTIVYIPSETKLKKVTLETGAGMVKINTLNTENLDLEVGAGKVEIENVIVSEKTEIAGGTGKLTINNSELNNSDIELGIGDLYFKGKMLGNSSIESGISNSNITLVGTKEEYKIRIEKAIGTVKIDNKNINSTIYGNGSNKLEISGGIGNFKIDFVKE